MKRRFIGTIVTLMACTSMCMAGAVTNKLAWNVPWGDTWRTRAIETLDEYQVIVNSLVDGTGFTDVTVDNATILDGLTVGTNATVGGTFGITGKATLEGELEVNDSDIDFNLALPANNITIDCTTNAGVAGIPLIEITDARTGTTADTADEASLVITAAGAYGLSVADGIVNIEGEIDTASGDITLDPAGDDVIVDGTVDATAYTADAASGIDVKSAGALDIGNAIATSIDYGSSAVTVHTFTSDGTGTGEIVLPLLSIGNSEIAADLGVDKLVVAAAKVVIGSAAGAGAAWAFTGDISLDTNGVTAVASLPAISGALLTGLAAANITPAGTLPQLDGSALTALDPANITGTGLVQADVWGAPGLTVTTNSASEIEVAIQTKTIAGGNLAERRFIRVYGAATEGGVASATDTASFVLTTGTDVETFTLHADYSYVTAVAGTALLTVTSSGASEKWITVIDGSSTTEVHLTFTGP